MLNPKSAAAALTLLLWMGGANAQGQEDKGNNRERKEIPVGRILKRVVLITFQAKLQHPWFCV